MPTLLLAALTTCTACTNAESTDSLDAAQTSPSPTAAAETPPASIDPRDQYALARAIAQARSSYEDLEAALARTRAAWIDQRYRWELAYVPALCGAVGPCVALPFDHLHDPEHPIRQGWLPRLELDPQQRQQLATQCEGKRRCVVDVSARLQVLQLSTDKPPSLTLSEVEVHGARPSRDGESWIMGSRRTAAAHPARHRAVRAG
ncbi:MAG: hypothetical protein AB1Z98_28135 [Nannocystaceae bacterium]